MRGQRILKFRSSGPILTAEKWKSGVRLMVRVYAEIGKDDHREGEPHFNKIF